MKLFIMPVVLTLLVALTWFFAIQAYRIGRGRSVSRGHGRATATYFHVPPEGCPAGAQLVPEMFEKDGKPVAGCYNPKGDGSIDVLYPGESVRLGFQFGLPHDMPEGKI